MALLEDVLFDNKWNSASFHDSLAVNALINTGIITPIRGSIRQDIDGLDSDNMKSVITSGIISRTFEEPKGMDASDDEITPNVLSQSEYRVKTYYQAYSELERSIQDDIAPMTVADARIHLINVFGLYWATHWNRIIAHMLKGFSTLAAITVGDGAANISRTMVLDARLKRGDLGFGAIGRMYMSSTTLYDALVKQEAETIDSGTIVETYGTNTIVVDGVTTVVASETPTYRFNGVTEIILDDDLDAGIIGVVDRGSFGIGERNLSTPLETFRNPLSGQGSGKTQVISRKSFILHPIGFNFTGVFEDEDFGKISELTYAELQGGDLYDIAHDIKETKITILKVLIGAGA